MAGPVVSASPQQGPSSRRGKGALAALSPGLFTIPLLRQHYRELTRNHLGRLFDDLLAEFTGLHFRVAWAPPAAHDWTAWTLRGGRSSLCPVAWTRGRPGAACGLCGPKQLARALNGGGQGHYFECRLGVHHYWCPIRVRRLVIGMGYLQARTRKRLPKKDSFNLGQAETRAARRAEFRRAGRLLGLIVRHLQSLDLADLRQAELARARHAVRVLQREHARLQHELQRLIPTDMRIPFAYGPGRRSGSTVQRLLERLHQHYGQPLTLQACARDLGRNAAYLSALFSKSVGLSFKTYLTELRLQKARELLRHPNRTVTDIAAVVGYASENRFRIAFKRATGLSPRAWREAFCC